MKNLKLEFTHFYFNCDNWKRKEVSIINNIISKGRLVETMKFSNYATITFDEEDHKHQFPIFNGIDPNDNKRANGLVYNLNGIGTYDKLIMYQTVTRSGGFYGFMTYDTRTSKYFHKFFITRDMYDLFIALNKFIIEQQNK